MKGLKGGFIRDWDWRRGLGDKIHTLVGGRLPNLVNFGCKLPRILDTLSHQVCADVWGQVVQEKDLELVDSVIQRKQASHLAHQGGRLSLQTHPKMDDIENHYSFIFTCHLIYEHNEFFKYF